MWRSCGRGTWPCLHLAGTLHAYCRSISMDRRANPAVGGGFGDFVAGVALLEEELDVTLITRSELNGINEGREQGREEGRQRSIEDVAEARSGRRALNCGEPWRGSAAATPSNG